MIHAQVTWTKKSPTSSPSSLVVMTYDIVRDRTVAYVPFATRFDSTWEWDGVNWIPRVISFSLPVGGGSAFVYDHARRDAVLYGGQVAGGAPTTSTWLWNGTTWRKALPATSPRARLDHAMAYDSDRQRVVMFGGSDISNKLDDTWEWDGMTWTQRIVALKPAPKSRHQMAYDALRRRTILFGGRETWEWDGAIWVQRFSASTPPVRGRFQMVYDTVRQRILLFSGRPVADTWEWDGVDWNRRVPLVSPAARDAYGMAYDRRRAEIVLFGGAGFGCGTCLFRDTWTYSTTQPASYTSFGSGCLGTTGIPTLTATPISTPWLGDTFQIQLQNLPAGAAASLVLGASSSQWGTLTLPFDLGVFGMPGCTLYASVDATLATTATGGTATFGIPLTIPNLVGGTFYNQGFVLDPGANQAGITVSNAARGVVGAR